MNRIIKLGDMDSSDGTLEMRNRVYSVDGVSATLTTVDGGGVLI